MPYWNQINFPNPNTYIAREIRVLFDKINIIIIRIRILISIIIISLIKNKFSNRIIYENQKLEIAWTIFPAIILIRMAIPSLRLLYLQDETWKPEVRLKVEAHQWYWDYEISNLNSNLRNNFFVSSFLNRERSSQDGLLYLMEVRNRAIIPSEVIIRFLITSADVLHSFRVPSWGIKMDAVPGRLNAQSIKINSVGVHIGQCREICGANHAFMPIVIEVVPKEQWDNFIEEIRE